MQTPWLPTQMRRRTILLAAIPVLPHLFQATDDRVSDQGWYSVGPPPQWDF